MSQAFTFGFEDNEYDGAVEPILEDAPPAKSAVQPAQLHTLQDLLAALPSQLSFSSSTIKCRDGGNVDIYRRELFDIRAQLMAEDSNPETPSVSGLSADDIVPNVYEGGYKTWECSTDLANFVYNELSLISVDDTPDVNIIEVGAGTALPSLSILRSWISRCQGPPNDLPNLHLCLTDYNRSVLELATIPNLVLNTCIDTGHSSDSLDMTPDLLEYFHTNLFKANINVSAISGNWSPSFAQLIPMTQSQSPARPYETLILASETVYSPASLQAFTTVLLDIFTRIKGIGGKVRALVAAKRVYFGVGGGTDEFLGLLHRMGGTSKIVWESEGPGVGRVIIEIL